MAQQPVRVSSRGWGADVRRGKSPVPGGGQEKERAEEKRDKGEPPSSYSSGTPQANLVAVFCDVCGDPKPAADVCFDALGCTHLFCFGCLSLRAAAEDDGGGVVPCPVPGCRSGFLDQQLNGVAPPPVAAEGEQAAEARPLTYFCSICMERKPPEDCFLDLRGCDHVFCAECVAAYVAAKVGENAVAAIRCPEPGCSGGRLEPEACQPVIPAPVFERWGAALCEAAVGEAARFYCPYRDCSALLWREEEGGQAPMRDAQCGHCRRVCCAQCRVPWHEGLTCEEYRRRADEQAETKRVMEMARQKKWQRCPKCGFVVERVEGCVFIRCRCSHCFCYRCASPMDPRNQKHYCHKCHLTWDEKQA